MAVPLDKFVKQLEDSGILVGNTIKEFLPPKSEPKDAEELARELVRKNKLTKFQAEEIYRGKGKSLVLGNYVLIEKLGAGGMGEVFKARHRVMNRVVAVKVLPTSIINDQAAIARFHREVQAAAKLNHPNIVTAYDADQANDVHFLVMELVDGSDLSVLVKKNGPLPVDKTLNYVLQAAKGLEAAHAEGIVHRDIKPANLLLDKKGTVKILDMGLARLNGDCDSSAEADLTSTGAIMGTVDYMAPEQALDTKTADARADIYALGCSLYYLLTGHAAYQGDTHMKKILAHREQSIPSLLTVRKDVPVQIDTIFRKMVAKKIEDRYQTMTEVITALEEFGTSQSARPSVDPFAVTILKQGAAKSGKGSTRRASVENKPAKKKSRSKSGGGNQKFIYGAFGASFFGFLILASIIVMLRTRHGTLIVEVDQPDAIVQVLDSQERVEITQPGGKGSVSISVEPGKHRLKVEKDGFTVFAEEFEMKLRDKVEITAKLVPLNDKAEVSATGWYGWPMDAPKPAISPFVAEQAMKHQEAWAKYLKIPVEFINSIGMKFRLIPPGEFTMGGTAAEIEESLKTSGDQKHWLDCINSESPQHKVILTQPIYLGVYEVTQAQYEKVMGTNPSSFSPTGSEKETVAGIDTTSHPVETVSFSDAAEFCAKLSQQEKLKPFYFRAGETVTPLDGTGYRLPTEAEWEFACRSGTTTVFWIGNTEEDLVRAGWFGTNSSGRTHAVGELKANPFGLFDVHGNVWEWVQDWWQPHYYEEFIGRPAINPNSLYSASNERVLKGGDFFHGPTACRVSTRFAHYPPSRYYRFGFRASLMIDTARKQPMNTTLISQDNQQPAPAAKKSLAFETPGFDQWMKDVAAMPAEKQVEAVSKKLVELNPGFDGKVTPQIEKDAVTTFMLFSDNVVDLSPVRAFLKLTGLHCNGSGFGKGRLTDLSPLKDMQLTDLNVGWTPVADLSPLKRTPIRTLHCNNTLVSDLGPLADSPLTELHIVATRVSDLTPLKGCKLMFLDCSATNIDNLSPLQGMPLKDLRFGTTQVSDLSRIKGMPLAELSLYNTKVSDLSPLQGMSLNGIAITPKAITQGMDLIRQMKSLKKIAIGWEKKDEFPPDEFWKKYDAGEFGKP